MSENFLLHDSMLFAPVRLGATSGYAHLDTGARHSAVLRSYAGPYEELGVRRIRGAFGAASVTQVRLDEISCLGKRAYDIPADVVPDGMGGFADLPFEVILALGADFLFQSPLYLDFPAQTIGFLDAPPSDLPLRVQLPASFRSGLAFFQMAAGPHSLQAVFDTGAAISVIDQQAAARLRTELLEDEPLDAEDPTGAALTLPTFRSAALRIGEHALHESRFLSVDLSIVAQKVGFPVDFVLGANAMLPYRWLVDRRRSLLALL